MLLQIYSMKRTSFDIKKKILSLLKQEPMSYAQLERKTNTGFVTIKNNCEELEIYGFLRIGKSKNHPKNGKGYSVINITEKGLGFLKKN